MIAEEPERFYRPALRGATAAGWGSGSTLPGTDWSEIAEIVTDAYRQIAPKTLAARCGPAARVGSGACGRSRRSERNCPRPSPASSPSWTSPACAPRPPISRRRRPQPDLWDDIEHAQLITSRLSNVQGELRRVEDLRRRLDDAQTLWDLAEEMDDADSRTEAEGWRCRGCSATIDVLEVRTLLSGEYDAREALVTIRSESGGCRRRRTSPRC